MGLKMASGWEDMDDEKEVAPSIEPKKSVKKVIAVKKDESTTDAISFTSKGTEDWLFNDNKVDESSIFCGIYGWDGTTKTGLAMDCRTPEEIKEGKKVVILDLDGGAGPLKTIYHNSDPNIVVRNPIERDENLDVDYEATFKRIKATSVYIEKNRDKHKICAVILDGLDKLLKICEYSMRDDLSIDATDGVSFRYWVDRNRKYLDVIEPLKKMGVNVFLITHLKAGETPAAEDIPVWQKKTPDMLFQKLKCFKVVDEDSEGNTTIEMKATIQKCKTNLSLEEKTYTIAKVVQKADGTSEEEWRGFQFRISDGEQRRTAVFQRNKKGVWEEQ